MRRNGSREKTCVGLLVRTILVVGMIYALSPVDTDKTPDIAGIAGMAGRALPSVVEALPASTGSLGRDAAAAALTACAARPQACADMAATLRGTAPPDRPPAATVPLPPQRPTTRP
jgi:hypothetical protein